MATVYIPLRQSEEQRATLQELTLDGVRIRLRSRYIALTDRWILDTLDLEDRTIIGSQALVTGVDLWLPFHHLAIPPGELFVSDPQTQLPASMETLDAGSLLLYREAS